MARLGIVIAVSENKAPFKSLSACAKDGAAVAAVLKETGRFTEVITLASREETASKSVQTSLSAFVERYRSQPVEEVVFYFSGHGEFAGDDFYHILSDYDAGSRNQTSLANSELDGLIRSLNPDLFCKIVDACYSGTSYIKSDDDLGDYLKSSKAGFKNAYFLYSSQGDEPSWTEGEISAFTKSLLQAIGRADSGKVRYRDLINAASDYFEAMGRQKPQFVTQASFTETFCDATPQMKALIETFVPPLVPSVVSPAPVTPVVPSPSKSLSLLDRVKEAEALYCTREQADAALVNLQQVFEKFSLSGELAELFSVYVIDSNEEVSGAVAIGEWLEKNVDNEFFSIPRRRTESYKKRVPKRRSALSSLNRWLSSPLGVEEDSELIDATRQVLSGYQNTVDLPFDSVIIRLTPAFKAINPEECVVAVLVSRSHVQLFWYFRHFRYSDWETAVPDNSLPQWSNEAALLLDQNAILDIGDRILKDFQSYALRRVVARWPAPSVPADTSAGKEPLIGPASKRKTGSGHA